MPDYEYISPSEQLAQQGGVQTAQRPSSGPTVAAPAKAVEPQPQGFDLGKMSTYGQAFNLLPQPVRDAGNAAWDVTKKVYTFLDTPLSERAGVSIPKAGGILGGDYTGGVGLDEVGNFLLQEATRPTNLLAAFVPESKLTKAPKLIRAAGFFLGAPSRSESVLARAASQAVMMTGARAGTGIADAALDKAGIDSTPLHIGAALLGGAVGGGLSLAGLSSAAEKTLGVDVLHAATPIGRVKVRPQTVQEFARRGVGEMPGSTPEAVRSVMSLPTADELTANGRLTADYFANTVLPDLDRQKNGAVASLVSHARQGYAQLGKVTEADGIQQITGARSGQPINLRDAIEFGATRYGADLSAEQLAGINKMIEAARAARSAKAAMLDGVPNIADLLEGQDFFPREVVSVNGKVREPVTGSTAKRTLGLTTELGREIQDSLLAQEKSGIRYEHPLATLEKYLNENLSDVVKLHAQDLLEHPSISASWLDRVNKGLLTYANKTRAQIGQTYDTLTGQTARAGEARFNADTSGLAAEKAGARTSTAEARYTALAKNVSSDDVASARAETSAAIDAAIKAKGEAQATYDRALSLGQQDSAMGKQLKKALDAADNALLEAEGYRAGAEVAANEAALAPFDNLPQPEWDGSRIIEQKPLAENVRPTTELRNQQSGADSLSAEYIKASKAADRLYAVHDGMLEQADRLAARLDSATLKSEAAAADAAGARYEVSAARQVERTLNQQQRALDAAQREFRTLERAEAATVEQARRAGVRETRITAMQAKSDVRLDKLREQMTTLESQVKANKESARLTPEGRTTLPQNQFPLLSGRDFAKADADLLVRAFTRFLPEETQAGGVLKKVAYFNQQATPWRAMADMSSTLNQLGWMAFSNPLKFVTNFARASKWAVRPAEYDKYLTDPKNLDAIAHGVAVMGTNMKHSVRQSDFELGSWAERIPGISALNRHFQILTTTNRIDLYNGLTHAAESSPSAAKILKEGLEGATATTGLSDIDRDSVARALNRLTGVATGINKGPSFLKGGRPGDLESVALFAPGFLRSGIETIVAAGMDGGIEGSLARQYIRNMVIGGQLLAFGVAAAQGRDAREVLNPFDVNAMKKGEFRLNPNFGSVRIGGQDISLYGRWDSLARLASASMDAPMQAISHQSVRPLFDLLGYGVSSKGSPLINLAGQVVQGGQTFNGNDMLSPAGLAENMLPFTQGGWVADMAGGASIGSATAKATVNFFGGKSNELTPFEQLDVASHSLLGKGFDALTGVEKDNVRESFPALVRKYDRQQEQRAASGDVKSQARVEQQAINAERMANEDKAYAVLQAGDLNLKEFNDALKNYAYAASKKNEQTQKVLGIDYGRSEGAKAALSEYFKTYRDAEKAPDVVDFDVQAQLEAELMRRIDDGEFGNPQAAHAAIIDRSRPKHSPEVQAFYDAKQAVSDSGYYDVADEAYQRVRARIEQVAGADIPTYGAFQVALNRATRGNDPKLVARFNAYNSQVQALTNVARQRMRLADPALEQALVASGRIEANSQFHRAVVNHQRVSTPVPAA